MKAHATFWQFKWGKEHWRYCQSNLEECMIVWIRGFEQSTVEVKLAKYSGIPVWNDWQMYHPTQTLADFNDWRAFR